MKVYWKAVESSIKQSSVYFRMLENRQQDRLQREGLNMQNWAS